MIKKIPKYLVLILCFSLSKAVLVTNRTVATISVGYNPTGSAITPDGKFVYVANNNNNSIAGGDNVSVINARTNNVVTTINDASFNEAYTVTINAAGTRAYVTNSNSTTVTIIDTTNNQVLGTITGFEGPSGFAISPTDPSVAYVNNYGVGVDSGNGTTVSVVNLNSNTITATITVDQAPAGLAITPNGEYLYVINYVHGNTGTGTVNVIKTSNNTRIKTINGFSGPFGIAITPDGSRAYVTNFGSNNFSPVGQTVSVIDLTNNSVIATVKVGVQPAGVAITPDGKLAYVTNYYTLYLGPGFTNLTPFTGTVNIIDVATNKVLCPVLVVGSSPGNISISPDGRRAYVSNYSSDNVTVLNIVDKMWLGIC